jgi:surface polysaccharide O-acyltransferase-like enzyme
MDVLGRSSVPLLTVISGWLYFESTRKKYFFLVWTKLKSLIMPMIIWSTITLLLVFVYVIITKKTDELPKGIWSLANSLFAISGPPISLQLGFLRDLFVIFLFSPLIRFLEKKLGILFLVLLAAASIIMPNSVILLRTQIVFFFVAGIYLARKKIWHVPVSWLVVAIVMVAVLFSMNMMALAQNRPAFDFYGRELILRMSVGVAVWYLAIQLSRRSKSLLTYLEPYAFLAFCSHVIVFRAFSIIGVKVFGGLASPLYPIYFTIQPIIGFAVALAFGWLMVRIAPSLLRPLNAGKLVPLSPPVGSRTSVAE